MSNTLRIFVVGGHGKVALHFTRYAAQAGHRVQSMIRQPEHASDLPIGPADNVQPVVASLEATPVEKLAQIFKDYDPNVVLFAAGAGGKGGPERTKAVDEEGAIKVFDALEKSGLGAQESFRRLLLVSAVDVRNPEGPYPDWYGDKEKETSQGMWKAIGSYMKAKYNADKNLSQRKAFPWFVLRPSGLLDEAGNGKVTLGEHQSISVKVPREDVARTLLAVAELPRGQADGLMLDLTAGNTDVTEAVRAAALRDRTDFLG